MIKIRSKRIALLLVLAMLATMFVGFGTASAASSENGILSISKSINKNISEEVADDLGYVKVSIDESDISVGTLYWSVTLPSDVYFLEEDGATSDSGSEAIATGTAISFTLPLDQVWVDNSAADDINVDVTVTYVDDNDNFIDKFDGTLLLAQKGTQNTVVTAASPKTVSMGFDKKIAKITFTEDIAGSLEDGSRIAIELPDAFEWATTMTLTQGAYGQLTYTAAVDPDDDQVMWLTIETPSTSIADKIKFVGYIDVYPDAPDGDVVVEVYDDSTGSLDSNVDNIDLTVAVVGGAEVTVTAEDTSSTSDYVYRADQNQELWEITLETSGSFTEGDDLLLTLPDGVQFMESIDAATDTFDGFINHGLYDDNQSIWLTVESDGTADLVLDGNLLLVGTTPAAKTGDLEITLSGDVVDATVVASTIVDRLAVTATKTNAKVGLNEVAGVITLVENKNKAFADDDEIWMQLPSGVTFSNAPTAKVNGDEVDVNVDPDDTGKDDVISIVLDGLKTNSKDTIVISDIEVDIDNRYTSGKEIAIKIGGISDLDTDDDVNRLREADPTDQFEKEYNDAVFTVAIATVGSASATNVVFTIGQASYVKDGVTIPMDVAPFVMNNRTFVPIRFMANALGIPDQNIYWDQANQTATLINSAGVVLQFKIGSTTRLRNGIAETMDVAPIAQNNRIFLPARFTADAYDALVGWDAATPNQVTISIK